MKKKLRIHRREKKVVFHFQVQGLLDHLTGFKDVYQEIREFFFHELCTDFSKHSKVIENFYDSQNLPKLEALRIADTSVINFMI